MSERKIKFKKKPKKEIIFSSLYVALVVAISLTVYFLTRSLGNTLLTISLGFLLYFLVDFLIKDKTNNKVEFDNKRYVAETFYKNIYKNTIANTSFKEAFKQSVDEINDESLRDELLEYINQDKILGLPPCLYSSTKETLVRISLYNMARVKVVRKDNLRKYKVSLDNFVTKIERDENIFFSFMYMGFAIYLFLIILMIVEGI